MLSYNNNIYITQKTFLNMQEQEILEEFGLNEKESKIYLELLMEESCTASQ